MTKYIKSPHLAARVIAGQAYIVDTESSTLHELSATGTFLWGLLETPRDEDALTRALCDEYDVTPEQGRKDVLEFLKELKEKGLVTNA